MPSKYTFAPTYSVQVFQYLYGVSYYEQLTPEQKADYNGREWSPEYAGKILTEALAHFGDYGMRPNTAVWAGVMLGAKITEING